MALENESGISITLINKRRLFLLFAFLLMVLASCSYLCFAFWNDMPILIKIMWPTISAIILFSMILFPMNGLHLDRKGNVLFVPDIRFYWVKSRDVRKIDLGFRSCENGNFSASVHINLNSGKSIVKDYSNEFKNSKYGKMAMSFYTIDKGKIERIRESIKDYDKISVSILE